MYLILTINNGRLTFFYTCSVLRIQTSIHPPIPTFRHISAIIPYAQVPIVDVKYP